MTPRDVELVAKLAAQRAGLRIEPDKHYLVENRLAPVARREGFGSLPELIAALRHRDEERLAWAVVEALSPAETAFFHDPETFELIAEKVLPDLARQRGGQPLRVWAAACGTGQEVYSLAILLAETPPADVGVELFASDLSERRLEKAQSGVYSQFEVQRGLSAHRLVRHFEGAEEGFALSPRIRQMVRWRRVNLLDDLNRLGQFDLVLCRNLSSALTETAQEQVMRNLSGAVSPGGWLILGPKESAPQLAQHSGLPGFHQRPAAQQAAA